MRFALLLFTISPVVFSSPYHDYSVDLTPSEELINGGSQVISSIPPRTDPESDAGTTGTVDSTGRDSTPSQDNVQPPDPGGLGGDPKIHVPGVYPFKAAPPCRRGDPAICKGKPFGSHLRSECFYWPKDTSDPDTENDAWAFCCDHIFVVLNWGLFCDPAYIRWPVDTSPGTGV